MWTAGLSILLTSCEKFGNNIVPSDNISKETRSVSGFNGIDVSSAFQVYVTIFDGEESIEIEANDNLHPYINVYEQGGSLVIKLENGIDVRGQGVKLKAYITTSDLSNFNLSDAASIELENELTSSRISIDMSDATVFTGEIYATDMYCNLSDGSEANLSGSSENLHLDISDASSFMDYTLAVDYLRADLSGASDVYITANVELSISASDASNLYYTGNGVIKSSDLSGASNVTRVN